MAHRHPSKTLVKKRSLSRSDLLRSFKPKSELEMRLELKNKFICGVNSLNTPTIRTSPFLWIRFRRSPTILEDLLHSLRALMRRNLMEINHSSSSKHFTLSKQETSDRWSLLLNISKTLNIRSNSLNTCHPSSSNSSSTNSSNRKVFKSLFKIQHIRRFKLRRIFRRLWQEAALLKTELIWN